MLISKTNKQKKIAMTLFIVLLLPVFSLVAASAGKTKRLIRTAERYRQRYRGRLRTRKATKHYVNGVRYLKTAKKMYRRGKYNSSYKSVQISLRQFRYIRPFEVRGGRTNSKVRADRALKRANEMRKKKAGRHKTRKASMHYRNGIRSLTDAKISFMKRRYKMAKRQADTAYRQFSFIRPFEIVKKNHNLYRLRKKADRAIKRAALIKRKKTGRLKTRSASRHYRNGKRYLTDAKISFARRRYKKAKRQADLSYRQFSYIRAFEVVKKKPAFSRLRDRALRAINKAKARKKQLIGRIRTRRASRNMSIGNRALAKAKRAYYKRWFKKAELQAKKALRFYKRIRAFEIRRTGGRRKARRTINKAELKKKYLTGRIRTRRASKNLSIGNRALATAKRAYSKRLYKSAYMHAKRALKYYGWIRKFEIRKR